MYVVSPVTFRSRTQWQIFTMLFCCLVQIYWSHIQENSLFLSEVHWHDFLVCPSIFYRKKYVVGCHKFKLYAVNEGACMYIVFSIGVPICLSTYRYIIILYFWVQQKWKQNNHHIAFEKLRLGQSDPPFYHLSPPPALVTQSYIR